MKAEDVRQAADAARDEGDHVTALSLYREAAELYSRAGDEGGRIRCKAWAGTLEYKAVGDREDGLDTLRETAMAARLCHDSHARYLAGLKYGLALYEEGRPEEAMTEFRFADAHLDELNSLELRSDLYHSAGITLIWAGRLEEAHEVLFRALVAAEAIDYWPGVADAWDSISHVWLLLNRPDKGVQAARKAVEAADRTDNPLYRTEAALGLGNALRMSGEYEAALEVLPDISDLPSAHGVPNVSAVVAESYRGLDLLDEAEAWLGRAEIEAENDSNPFGRCNVLLARAWLAHDRGLWASCGEWASGALTLFLSTLGGNTRPTAVRHLLFNYRTIFELGVTAADRTATATALWDGIKFIDAARCVAIREALRRSGGRRARDACPWPAAVPPSASAFAQS
jgi:tetratricopeptide (TPR) repeat protein